MSEAERPESGIEAKPRKRAAKLLLAGFGLLALLFVLGPRPSVDTRLPRVDLPADLDAYLRHSEARFPDIRPDTEKLILPAKAKSPALALVFLHGFSASRRELSPLCEDSAQALAAALFMTRLRGHGRSGPAMAEARVEDWIRDGQEAIAIGRRLAPRVVLIGSSTGASLALWLAAQAGNEDLAGLVLVSPNFRPRRADAQLLTMPWGSLALKLIQGETRSWRAHNALQERFWTTSYPSSVLVTMMALTDLLADADLRRIRAPTLVLYSKRDRVVNSELIERRFPEIGAARKELFEVGEVGDPSQHVLAGEVLSPADTPRLSKKVVAFLKPLIQGTD